MTPEWWPILGKIQNMRDGATTPGEKDAADRALERVVQRCNRMSLDKGSIVVWIPDQWPNRGGSDEARNSVDSGRH